MQRHDLSRHLYLFVISLAALLFSPLGYTAAFQFYELGTPIIGTAGVGQAVIASDASTAYFNPAGMAVLPTTEMMLGSQIILPYTNFSPNASNTMTGNNGGNAGLLAPGIGGYYVYNISPKFKAGISLTSPYGGALNYNTHWVGRYIVQQMTLFTINLNPALAYQATDWLSIGGGIAVEYANLYQTNALRITSALDGQISIKADDTSPGFNLGVLFTPTRSTKIGIAYRSQIVHHLSGNINFLNISDTPEVKTRMVMPANVIASISQAMNANFTLLGEVGWADWSSMRNEIVTIKNYTTTTPQNWKNTYRAGIGGQYQVSPVLLQAGASYDSSPTNTTYRTPNLPMDRQIRLGVGVGYAMNKAASLGLSYEYLNLGKAPINDVSSTGTLAGNYSRNYANVVQASLNVEVT